MKLYIFMPKSGDAPLLRFISALDPKLRRKVLTQFQMLEVTPLIMMREPHVKHFKIEKYKGFYELRAKHKVMVRIIFTPLENGDILFLAPFVKRHTRNTMQALDLSLKMLAGIKEDAEYIKELTISDIRRMREIQQYLR